LRSLPDARAGFTVSACSLGMPHARPLPYWGSHRAPLGLTFSDTAAAANGATGAIKS